MRARLIFAPGLLGLLVCAAAAMAWLPTAASPRSPDGAFEKVRERNHPMLSAALRADPRAIASRDSLGYTLLHWAAAVDDETAARLLLDAGADPNARDVRGQTPLHVAAMSQVRSGGIVMNTLVARGAHVDAADARGLTPVQIARSVERDDLAKTLLAAGATETAKVKDAIVEVTADARVADAGSERSRSASARASFDLRPRRRPMGPLRAWARLNGLRPPPPPALHSDG